VAARTPGEENIEEYFELVLREIEIFRKNLDLQSVESLVKNLSEAQGPLIFIGIGASEINAKRAQHLCNSIGKPSIAPTVSNLLHGGIGGLTLSNSIVVFSKSGLTDEILRLTSLLDSQRYRIFLVTENEKLKKTEISSYRQVVELGPSIESDLNRVLPTTSNLKVNMLIDLLARGLQIQLDSPFRLDRNHPGGMLGKLSSLTLSEVLEENWKLRHTRDDSDLNQVLDKITKFGIGGISITDKDSRLVGIISDGDIRRNLSHENLDLSTKDVRKMIFRKPTVIQLEKTVEKAIDLVNQNRHLSFFPVVNHDGAFVATVTSRELLTLRLSGL
jgi:arabinose-5-phosphate isomerase